MRAVNEETKFQFRQIAEKASRALGSSQAFFIAILLICAWGGSGFYFGFNDTWQLIINTGTTIGTFMMVILVQNTQTREARSIQLKLDEILYGTKNSRNSLIGIELQSDEEMEQLEKEYMNVRKKYIESHKRPKQK